MLERVNALLEHDERPAAEKQRLAQLICLFAELPPPPDPYGLYSRYAELKGRFERAAREGDWDTLEASFLALYCHVHGYEVPYTDAERRRVDAMAGYLCHPGGLSPILKAEPFVTADTVSGDFGAGNGLQGLLMQFLYPHTRAVQIEISSRMVDAGRHLQRWIGIDEERVQWIVGDISDVSPEGMDFIYLYRPVRPAEGGKVFYEEFAQKLELVSHPVVVFSVADCLGGFLSGSFHVFYDDGHLKCFRNQSLRYGEPDEEV